jgi:Asp/Glu/hydantoin racemase
VTRAMDEAIDILRRTAGVQIDCGTLKEGPPGIESQADVESVVLPTVRRLQAEPTDAYVIACFSDPGLHLAREVLKKPVLGIAESAYLAALGLGHRFGVVAILERSIPRHMRAIRMMGLEGRLAADRALGIGVTGLSDRDSVIGRIVAVGRTLRDQDGADVIILGCASMGRYRSELEDRLEIPVVDPCQAAVARAVSLLTLGYRTVA